MSKKENIKKFIGNTGYICSKCGKIVIDGKTHENQEGICEDCLIAELKQQVAELQEKYDACQEARKLEIEFKNQEFDEHIQELIKMEKKLTEKDKEIKELKKDLKSQKGLTDLYLTIAGTNATKMSIEKATRHQICEEIRDELFNTEFKEAINDLGKIWLFNLLEQIENGE